MSLVSAALAGGFFPTAPPGEPVWGQEGSLIAQRSERHSTGDISLETAIEGAAYGDPVSSHHGRPLPGLLEQINTHYEHLLCARPGAKNVLEVTETTIIICFVQMRKSQLRKLKYQIQAHWWWVVEPGFDPNLMPGISHRLEKLSAAQPGEAICLQQWGGVFGGAGFSLYDSEGFLRWLSDKESACVAEATETWVQSLGREDPLEKEMTTHSSILS